MAVVRELNITLHIGIGGIGGIHVVFFFLSAFDNATATAIGEKPQTNKRTQTNTVTFCYNVKTIMKLNNASETKSPRFCWVRSWQFTLLPSIFCKLQMCLIDLESI